MHFTLQVTTKVCWQIWSMMHQPTLSKHSYMIWELNRKQLTFQLETSGDPVTVIHSHLSRAVSLVNSELSELLFFYKCKWIVGFI